MLAYQSIEQAGNAGKEGRSGLILYVIHKSSTFSQKQCFSGVAIVPDVKMATFMSL